ncbi:MAG: alanine racemase [Nitrospinae bacterium]|nr:alanine racemase [Nitrospinota bacterium]
MSEHLLPSGYRNALFVDLDILTRNYENLTSLLVSQEPFAVVKAEGYGHGGVEVARAVYEAGGRWFGVAAVEEAKALRAADAGDGFTDARILVMSDTLAYNAKRLVEADCDAAVWRMEQVEGLAVAARVAGRKARIHVKVDTGMGRLGLHPPEAVDFIERASREEGVEVVGLMSHFARADEEEGGAATGGQIHEMEALIHALREKNLLPPHVHMSNSAGLLNYSHAPGNLVRLGIALYGSSPQFSESVALKSAMTWVARVLQVKEIDAGQPVGYGGTYERNSPGRIAMVTTGYGDGYPRILSNRADALVGGVRVPVAGRVSMDMLALDVTRIENIAPEDQVVLLGEQGDGAVSCEEMADRAETIPYEIMCGVGVRVPRVYLREGRVTHVRKL